MSNKPKHKNQSYYVVPNKNLVTNKVPEIKVFTDKAKAEEYEQEKRNDKFDSEGNILIQRVLFTTYARNENEAIEIVQELNPEDSVDGYILDKQASKLVYKN